MVDAKPLVIPYFVIWWWHSPTYRTTYTIQHVNTMVAMLLRACVPMDRIILVTDRPSEPGLMCRTHPLWNDHSDLQNVSGKNLPSCYRRLKLFDPVTRAQMGIPEGVRVVSIDIDAVIIPQNFLQAFQRPERYVGWFVPGRKHQTVMNGSMWMFTAGEVDWLWENFDPVKSPASALANGYMGSDQGYLSHMLMQQPWLGGWSNVRDGVLSYTRDVRALRVLPKHTKVVFFPGARKPWDEIVKRQSTWIGRYAFIHPETKEQSKIAAA